MSWDTFRLRTKKIGFQIATFYLAVGLLVIVLLSTIIYFFVSDIFVKEAISKTQMATEKSAKSISEYMSYTKNTLKILAENPEIIPNTIHSVEKSNKYVCGVFALFEDSKIYGSQDKILANDFTFEDFQNDSPSLTNARIKNYSHMDEWIITMSVPIISKEGQAIGTVIADLDYCLFKYTLSDLNIGEVGSAYIINSSKELLFHSDEEYLKNNGESKKNVFVQNSGYDRKANILTYSTKIEGTDWQLVSSIYLENLNILKRQLFDLVFFTGILLFIGLLCITTFISRKLTQPISNIVKSMEDIEELAYIATVSEPTEAKVLTESYNLMITKIKTLMIALKKTEGEKRQAEMDALTSQINPHFLYNTLDTIIWLAEFRDNDRIISITKSLAAFFRLSLNGGKVEVSIFDEIEHVKEYLLIQKERYDDKLTYTFNVDEEILDMLVPKLILQPIVENSIYHGIKPMDGVGHIEISVKKNGNETILSIKDNGVGFDTQNPQGNTLHSGVGIQNVRNRIKLYFGDSAEFKVVSEPNVGTTVSIIVKDCKESITAKYI